MSFGSNSMYVEKSKPLTGVQFNAIMRNVYGWMTMGLLITAFVSMLIPALNIELSPPILIGVLVFHLVTIFGLNWAFRRLSATVIAMLFIVYAAINGVSFSLYLGYYSGETIMSAAITSAAVFGAMTLVGMTTKVDLSKYSTYFFMGVIGLIIAGVVNIFLGSSMLQFIISIAGVLIFTALTAYDTQKVKELASDPHIDANSEETVKLSIFAAFMLYLDLVILFRYLLFLFGGFDD